MLLGNFLIPKNWLPFELAEAFLSRFLTSKIFSNNLPILFLFEAGYDRGIMTDVAIAIFCIRARFIWCARRAVWAIGICCIDRCFIVLEQRFLSWPSYFDTINSLFRGKSLGIVQLCVAKAKSWTFCSKEPTAWKRSETRLTPYCKHLMRLRWGQLIQQREFVGTWLKFLWNLWQAIIWNLDCVGWKLCAHVWNLVVVGKGAASQVVGKGAGSTAAFFAVYYQSKAVLSNACESLF